MVCTKAVGQLLEGEGDQRRNNVGCSGHSRATPVLSGKVIVPFEGLISNQSRRGPTALSAAARLVL